MAVAGVAAEDAGGDDGGGFPAPGPASQRVQRRKLTSASAEVAFDVPVTGGRPEAWTRLDGDRYVEAARDLRECVTLAGSQRR